MKLSILKEKILKILLFTNIFKINLTRYIITTTVTIIFIINIVANPFTELCPKINIIIAAIIVIRVLTIIAVIIILSCSGFRP